MVDRKAFEKQYRPEPPAEWPDDKKQSFRKAAAKITIRELTEADREMYRIDAPFLVSYEKLKPEELFMLRVDTTDASWSMVSTPEVKKGAAIAAAKGRAVAGEIGGKVAEDAYLSAKRESVIEEARGKKFVPGRHEGATNKLHDLIEKALTKAPTLGNQELWDALAKKPPKGWEFFTSKHFSDSQHISRTGEGDISWNRFKTVAGKVRTVLGINLRNRKT